jgi:hypothetical protein
MSPSTTTLRARQNKTHTTKDKIRQDSRNTNSKTGQDLYASTAGASASIAEASTINIIAWLNAVERKEGS